MFNQIEATIFFGGLLSFGLEFESLLEQAYVAGKHSSHYIDGCKHCLQATKASQLVVGMRHKQLKVSPLRPFYKFPARVSSVPIVYMLTTTSSRTYTRL
jgi:hypothetical protein